MKGIDVSTIQGVIDWSKVYNDDVRFAMIKATQGRGEGAATKHLKRFTDSRFASNIKGAASVGLGVGVYHYFTATTVSAAREEAEYFCKVIAPYKDKITLWAAVDVESKYLDGLSKDELYASVRAFMDVVEKRGFESMIYTNPNFLKYRFPAGAFDKDAIWLAHWNVKTPMEVPNMHIWQYGVGKVAGIRGSVDMNVGQSFVGVVSAICRLASIGLIDTPEYWFTHHYEIPYIDELLIKAAEKIGTPRTSSPTKNIGEALKRLADAGVINTPEYWQKNHTRVKWLTELILKLGGSV